MAMRKWLTSSDLARMLDVSGATVRRWAREKQVPHLVTPGGHYRFERTEILKFIQSRRSSSSLDLTAGED